MRYDAPLAPPLQPDAPLTDSALYQSLVKRYHDKLVNYAYRRCRCRQTAEDVVQETWLRAWRALDSLRDADAVQAWLFTIVRREHARLYERKRPELCDVPVEELGVRNTDCDTSPEALALHCALRGLDAGYREPFLMQVIEGCNYEEIAERTGLSKAAVTSRLHRARQRLQAQLTV